MNRGDHVTDALHAHLMVKRDGEYRRKHALAYDRYMREYDSAAATRASRLEATDRLTREQAAIDRAYADVLKWRERRDYMEEREGYVDVLASDVRDVLAFAKDEREFAAMMAEALARGKRQHKEETDG